MGPKKNYKPIDPRNLGCVDQLGFIVWVHFKNVCVFAQYLWWIPKGIQELINDGVDEPHSGASNQYYLYITIRPPSKLSDQLLIRSLGAAM